MKETFSVKSKRFTGKQISSLMKEELRNKADFSNDYMIQLNGVQFRARFRKHFDVWTPLCTREQADSISLDRVTDEGIPVTVFVEYNHPCHQVSCLHRSSSSVEEYHSNAVISNQESWR